MINALHDLHLEEKAAFLADRHKIAAAEFYLRRSLEALFDIGLHIFAKKFAYPATEYRRIACFDKARHEWKSHMISIHRRSP